MTDVYSKCNNSIHFSNTSDMYMFSSILGLRLDLTAIGFDRFLSVHLLSFTEYGSQSLTRDKDKNSFMWY